MSSFQETAPARWRTSTRCGASNGCVEVARLSGAAISVRATEDPLTRLAFTPSEWLRFIEDAKDGRFDDPWARP